MKLFARTVSRMAAVQALFYWIQHKDLTADQLVDRFRPHVTPEGCDLFDDGLVGVDGPFFEALVHQAIAWHGVVAQQVHQVLPQGWEVAQLEGATHSLFLCAGAEMVEGKTPKQVLMNEYINAAHHFLLDKGPGFVNGVLESLWPALSTHKQRCGEEDKHPRGENTHIKSTHQQNLTPSQPQGQKGEALVQPPGSTDSSATVHPSLMEDAFPVSKHPFGPASSQQGGTT